MKAIRICLALLTSAVVLFAPSAVIGQAPPDAADTRQGFSLTPPTMDLLGSPGEVIRRQLLIENPANQAQPADFEFSIFTADGEDGHPRFSKEEGQHLLSSWMSLSTNKTVVGPKETAAVELTINIPQNAEPGGHYAAVLVRTILPPPPGESAVAISPEVASLVLLRVSGETRENASLESFKASADRTTSGPIGYEVRVRNTGNVHVRASGIIEVKDVLGRTVDQVPLAEATVLPETVRRFTAEVPAKWVLGPYKAKVTMTYGTSKGQLTASTTTWFVNIKATSIIAGVLLLVVVIYLLGRRSARSKSKKDQ